MSKRKKKPLAVILDLDDTAVSFLGYLCRWHNKLHKTHLTEHDILSWEFPPELDKTFREWEEFLYLRLPLKDGTRETLVCFRALGYKIIFMTARDEKFKRATFMNIEDNDLPYDELIFSKDKAKDIRRLAKDFNIRIFADDKLETVIDVAENTNVNHVYLIETAANRDKEIDEDIKRIYSIRQILMDDIKEVK
jgi:uncharacterized HAD superfamily protein